MNTRERKLAILRHLGQEAEPIGLSELVVKLEFHNTNRTICRLLKELIAEGLVKKFGNTKGARYLAVKAAAPHREKTADPFRQESNFSAQVSGYFGEESLGAIGKVTKPLFLRHPVTYNTEWLNSYEPNITFYLSASLRAQLQEGGQRASKHGPVGTYAHEIYDRLLIDLSYNSSRLEGNTYSLLDTERLLLYGNSAEGKLDIEKVMILNHKEAIRYLVDNSSKLEVTRNGICTLHYLLSDGLVETQYAGKVRDFGVRIGGSTYIPFEDPKRLQSQLDKIAKKAAMIRDPFEQSLFLLVHISYLQPFVDVNKRTSRLSANIPLIMGNLVPLAFSDVEVGDYMSAMIAIYELQDVHPLVDLYVYSYMRTCAAYDSTVKALGFDEIRVRYRLQRRKIIREIILQEMTGSRVGTFIMEEGSHVIPKEDLDLFIEDSLEDLEQMEESRIGGLGVTSAQLDKWLAIYRKNPFRDKDI